jgi:signal transduction histidine kinase
VTEILQSLTDAASLEQALHSEQSELVDLAQLVTSYVTNFASLQLVRGFSVRGADAPVLVEASAFRLEQLLDKLVDNAVAFSPAQSEILVALQVSEGSVQLDVENEGPLLPEDLRERLFESMTTSRGAGGASAAACDDRPHLGIGLYVVRLIAEHLGGSVHARNRDDGLGVVASVRLPLADLDLPRNAKG